MRHTNSTAEDSSQPVFGRAARPRRRWLRFSLRSLLIVITLLCVMLGWWVNRLHRRHAAIATLQASRATIDFENVRASPENNGQPLAGGRRQGTANSQEVKYLYPGPAWLRRWVGEYAFARVHSVTVPHSEEAWRNEANLAAVSRLRELRVLKFRSPSVTDEDLVRWKWLRNLEHLDIAGASITSRGLANLRGMRELAVLDLSDTGIDNGGLAHLAELPRLVSLKLNDVALDDEGMAFLVNCNSLRSLELTNTNVTDAGLHRLQLLPGIRKLGIAGTKVDGSFLRVLDCEKLTLLDLRYTALTDNALPRLAKLPNLQHVELEGCWEISDEAMVQFQSSVFPQCEVFWVGRFDVDHFPVPGYGAHRYYSGMTTLPAVSLERQVARLQALPNLLKVDLLYKDLHGQDLSPLGELTELQTLRMRSTKGASEDWSWLAQMHSLRDLDLRDTEFTDADMVHLAGLLQLERLDLCKTNVSDEGLKHLSSHRNLQGLWLAGTEVNGSGLASLTLDALEELDLAYTPLTSENLVHAARFPAVETVYLRGCWKLSQEEVEEIHLRHWADQHTQFDWQPVDDMTVFYSPRLDCVDTSRILLVLRYAKLMKSISLQNRTLKAEHLLALTELEHLTKINLDGCEFSTALVEDFPLFAGVEELCLSDTNIDDRVIESLVQWHRLKMLDLRDTSVTEAGAERLRQALPQCLIHHKYRDPNAPDPGITSCP